jgi:hypothetical protein
MSGWLNIFGVVVVVAASALVVVLVPGRFADRGTTASRR